MLDACIDQVQSQLQLLLLRRLYFRLNVIPIMIPPLREREGDIEPLLRYALKKFNILLNKNIQDFHPEALRALLNYSWPGNVRELENVVEYAVNMVEENIILLENIPDKILKRKRNFNGKSRAEREDG